MLSTLNLKAEYRSDRDRISRDFLERCLQRSCYYRRAVGYFTSSGLSSAARGLKQFADAGGIMYLVASPLLDAADFNAIERGEKAQQDAIERALLRELSKDIPRQDVDRFVLLAWLIADELLEIKLAMPVDLVGLRQNAIYHEKIGILSDDDENHVAFTGSPNETQGGLVSNFESIDVYWSWDDPHGRVRRKMDNFERLWKNHTQGLNVVSLPEAVRDRILKFRQRASSPGLSYTVGGESFRFSVGLWNHQEAAVESFREHRKGVLEMATGTGKTRTALAIAEKLLDAKEIRSLIIAADGVDLLDQWGVDVLRLCGSKSPPLRMYRHYEAHKEIEQFLMSPMDSVLLVSRYFLASALRQLDRHTSQQILLVHDEVHKLGSPSNRQKLQGLSDSIAFRLGLSATPEREYDEEGNAFIGSHIGPVIFRYEIKDAIEDGILAPFDYYALDYWPNDEDRGRISNVYKKVAARKQEGNPMSKAEIWTDLARVYKTSRAKLPIFMEFLKKNQELLDRCIIFVETMSYGREVIEIVHRYKPSFHTYFGGEDQAVLERFAQGELDCLLTCHRLSEGIDIRSLQSVILFSSARSRLETIQRIGRCLRVDPLNPQKRAGIVDFIRADRVEAVVDDQHAPTDILRKNWLSQLGTVRPRGER